MLNFVVEVVDAFNVSDSGVRVGVITYSSFSKVGLAKLIPILKCVILHDILIFHAVNILINLYLVMEVVDVFDISCTGVHIWGHYISALIYMLCAFSACILRNYY